jgi:hypothetical protein
MAGKLKGKIATLAKRNKGEKMTVTELMHHNFDEIFIEIDPEKREAMMRNAYTEDCVWIHPGGRLVGIAANNEAASESRKRIPEYRYTVVGDIHTMHNVGMCRWGSGLLTNRFAIPVRTFWRNATAVLLCSTPSSIVELRRSRRRNKAFAWMENVAGAQ